MHTDFPVCVCLLVEINYLSNRWSIHIKILVSLY